MNASEAINSAGGVSHRRRRQAERQHPGGAAKGLNFLVERLQAGLHPQGSHHLQGGGGPPRLPGGQADLPAQLAVRVRPGQRRRGLARSRASSRWPRCPGLTAPASPASAVTTWRSRRTPRTRRRALDFIKFFTSEESQTEEPGAGLAGSAFAVALRRPGAAEEVPVPAHPARLDPQRAVPRPKVVRYGDATTAIQDAAYAALTGTKSTADALKDCSRSWKSITRQVIRRQLG